MMPVGLTHVIVGVAWATLIVTLVLVLECWVVFVGLKVTDSRCWPTFSTVPAVGE